MLGRSVRTSQPQGPARVDWSNPITRGLFVAETPSKRRGAEIMRPVTGGVSYMSDGTAASGIAYDIPPITVGDFTLFMQGRGFTNTAAASAFTLTGPTDQSNNSAAALMFNVWASGGSWGFDGVDIGRDRGISLNNQQERVAVIVRSGTSLSLYLNGTYAGAATLGSGGTFLATGVKLFSKGGSNVDIAASGSYIKTYGAAGRALSVPEIKSLSDNPWQIFAPDSKSLWVPTAASVSLPTLVQPNATTSAGAWTATGAASLHDAINELVPSDTQYISVNSASTTELLLAESAHPGAANQTLAYRASSTQNSTLTVTLKQGVTTIMSRTHSLTGIDTLYTQTLTSGEIALITAGAISVTLTTS